MRLDGIVDKHGINMRIDWPIRNGLNSTIRKVRIPSPGLDFSKICCVITAKNKAFGSVRYKSLRAGAKGI